MSAQYRDREREINYREGENYLLFFSVSVIFFLARTRGYSVFICFLGLLASLPVAREACISTLQDCEQCRVVGVFYPGFCERLGEVSGAVNSIFRRFGGVYA